MSLGTRPQDEQPEHEHDFPSIEREFDVRRSPPGSALGTVRYTGGEEGVRLRHEIAHVIRDLLEWAMAQQGSTIGPTTGQRKNQRGYGERGRSQG